MAASWWRDAVVYEIYVRSFNDSDGDGVGDLVGIRERLPYVAGLGVDAIWLTPFYPSPMRDHGYDVADYCAVDPLFGSLEDFDALLDTAHTLGLRVYVDVVPNHTSSDHPWFREAVADPRSPKRDWYVFRPPAPGGGPPNDWQSAFGGSAWDLDEASGDYYLHLFDSSQPDLDWRNPAVHDAFRHILRFWLDRGVDGFRIDVAHALYKDRQLRDGARNAWDQDDVVEIWQEWRRLLDGYADRAFVGEVFLYDMERVARYVGPDRLHQAFNFSVAKLPFDAAAVRDVVGRAVELFDGPGTTPTWVLSNHDLVRHPTRYGGGERGIRRGRAMTAFVLALPGSPYLYQGEELGLEETDVPPSLRQDPAWLRAGETTRDGCRTPFPWTADAAGHGFTTGRPWLPLDPQASTRNVEVEAADPGSTLAFYRQALTQRRRLLPALRRHVGWLDLPPGCVGFRRQLRGGEGLAVVLNTAAAAQPVEVSGAAEVLLTSAAADAPVAGGRVRVPAEATVWIRTGVGQ